MPFRLPQDAANTTWVSTLAARFGHVTSERRLTYVKAGS
jgi:hypothetical protein